MTRRVVITGIRCVTAFGETWEVNREKILNKENAVRFMTEWDDINGLITRLGAPCDSF